MKWWAREISSVFTNLWHILEYLGLQACVILPPHFTMYRGLDTESWVWKHTIIPTELHLHTSMSPMQNYFWCPVIFNVGCLSNMQTLSCISQPKKLLEEIFFSLYILFFSGFVFLHYIFPITHVFMIHFSLFFLQCFIILSNTSNELLRYKK